MRMQQAKLVALFMALGLGLRAYRGASLLLNHPPEDYTVGLCLGT